MVLPHGFDSLKSSSSMGEPRDARYKGLVWRARFEIVVCGSMAGPNLQVLVDHQQANLQ